MLYQKQFKRPAFNISFILIIIISLYVGKKIEAIWFIWVNNIDNLVLWFHECSIHFNVRNTLCFWVLLTSSGKQMILLHVILWRGKWMSYSKWHLFILFLIFFSFILSVQICIVRDVRYFIAGSDLKKNSLLETIWKRLCFWRLPVEGLIKLNKLSRIDQLQQLPF